VKTRTIKNEVAWPAVPEKSQPEPLREFLKELTSELFDNPEASIYFSGGGDEDIECTIYTERPENEMEIAAREKLEARYREAEEARDREEYRRLQEKFGKEESPAHE
jgi:hypothetical protein